MAVNEPGKCMAIMGDAPQQDSSGERIANICPSPTQHCQLGVTCIRRLLIGLSLFITTFYGSRDSVN